MRWLIILSMVSMVGACRRSAPSTQTPLPPPPASADSALDSSSTPAKPAASIGTATMRPDRAIVLRLRAESGGGAVGDAQMIYRPGDGRYDEILRHVGGLRVGEEKPVPPWPDAPR